MDKGSVYLERYDFNFKTSSIIDSAEIVNKKFKFHLVNKKIHSCSIIVKDYPYENVLYLDKENINVRIDTSTKTFEVQGGKENAFYTSYLKKFEKLFLPIENLRKKTDGIITYSERLSIEDSIFYYDSILHSTLRKIILKNKDLISTLVPISQFKNRQYGQEGLALLNKMSSDIRKTKDWLNVERNFNTLLNKTIAKNAIAPDFSIRDSAHRMISLHQFKGKVILLDFWASWCIPCIKGFPFLKEIAKKYIPKGLVLISISIDNYAEAEKWRNALVRYDLHWVNLIDDKARTVQTRYEVDFIPKQILIDRDGKIYSVNIQEAHLEDEIGKLFKK